MQQPFYQILQTFHFAIMIPLYITRKNQEESHLCSQINLFRNHRLETNKQANKNTSSLNPFSLYWKSICSLGIDNKFIGYIHSKHILIMNHQWYTAVVALYTPSFHQTLSYTIKHCPTMSSITVFSVRHQLLHPCTDASWFGSVKAVLCSAYPANQQLERLLQVTRANG